MKPQTQFLIRYILQTLGLIVLLGILIRTFWISSYIMTGYSMIPTVWPGDFLIATQVVADKLERGDLVLFRCPPNRDKICMKRVVATAGDRVEMRGGVLEVNGQRSERKPLPDQSYVVESVLNHSRKIWPQADKAYVLPPVVIPPRQIFVLSDKRADLDDSRNWGPVPANWVEAKGKFIWLSLDWVEGDQIRSWPRVRWDRILLRID